MLGLPSTTISPATIRKLPGVMWNPPPNRRITALDGWRGISILCVVFAHLTSQRYGPNPHVYHPSIPAVLSLWGVDIFFVISGFIISRLTIFEYDTNGYFNIYAFYVRRLARIIPPLYIYLLFIFLVSNSGLIFQNQQEIFAAATLTCNFPHTRCGWFPGHFWTLAYEEQFYLAFPIIFAVFRKNTGAVLIAILFAIIMVPFFRYLLNLEGSWRVASEFTPSFSFICIGCLISFYESLIKRVICSTYSSCISIVNWSYLGFWVIYSTYISNYPESIFNHLRIAFENIALPVSFSWLIASAAFNKNIFTRFLNNKILQFLGMISYSLYIWQMVFTAAPDLYLKDSWLLFPPLMLGAACVSYYLVERPGVLLGKRLLSFVGTRSRKLV